MIISSKFQLKNKKIGVNLEELCIMQPNSPVNDDKDDGNCRVILMSNRLTELVFAPVLFLLVFRIAFVQLSELINIMMS